MVFNFRVRGGDGFGQPQTFFFFSTPMNSTEREAEFSRESYQFLTSALMRILVTRLQARSENEPKMGMDFRG